MHLRAISAALAIGIVLAGAAVGSRWFDARPADAFVEPTDAVYLALDCDTVTPGVQDACAYPSGTASVQVDVVLGNTTASSFELGAFNFTVAASPQQVADPPVGADSEFNANPNANEGVASPNTWACTPPPPDNDTDADPAVARSFLACFNLGTNAPEVPAGAALKLARITYNTADGPATLSFDLAEVGDVDGFPWLLCLVSSDPCFGADLVVGADGTLTPTPTQTFTPTATPTFQPVMTPSGTPVGGVSDVVGLGIGMCAAGAVAFEGVPDIDAATRCATLNGQQSLQFLTGCIRASDVDLNGVTQCFEGVSLDDEEHGLLLPAPADIEAIDFDADQVHAGHALIVLAFVDGDWPVLFETSAGGFVQPGTEAASLLCYTPQSDTDCDADPNTVGDGVVVMYLIVTDGTPQGPATVTITQAGVAQTLEVNVTGPPDHMELEVVDDKDTIRTGATSCADLEPPWGVDNLKTLAADGIDDEQKTVAIARVYDASSRALASTVLNWTPAYDVGTTDPLGGGSSPGLVTMDLGEAGFGAVQVICSKDLTGDLVSQANYIQLFDPFANFDAVPTITIHVVDELPTATATAQATDTATATATETPTSTSTPVPTSTSTPTSTNTPIIESTDTPTPEATQTAGATVTAEGTAVTTQTAQATRTAGATETVEATDTPTSTQTPVPTSTNTATATPTASPSATASATSTATPSASPTASASHTQTSTPTVAASATKTAVPTSTRTPRADRTSTPASTRTVVPAVTAVRSATPFSTVLASRATPPAGVVLPDTGDGGLGGGGGAMPVVVAIAAGALAIVGAGWRMRARSR